MVGFLLFLYLVFSFNLNFILKRKRWEACFHFNCEWHLSFYQFYHMELCTRTWRHMESVFHDRNTIPSVWARAFKHQSAGGKPLAWSLASGNCGSQLHVRLTHQMNVRAAKILATVKGFCTYKDQKFIQNQPYNEFNEFLAALVHAASLR